MPPQPDDPPRTEGRASAAGQHSADYPRRVRVTSSRRTAAAAPRRTVAAALVEQTGAGELYLSGLLRAQLRLTLTVLAVVAVAMLGLPVLFALVPEITEVRAFGIPVPWLALGVLLYPVMIAAAAYYTRQSQRLERSFTEVVTRERE